MYTAETLNADKKFSHEDAKSHPQAAFELFVPIFSSKMRKKDLFNQRGALKNKKKSLRRCSGWLQLSFHLRTENLEGKLKNPPCIRS